MFADTTMSATPASRVTKRDRWTNPPGKKLSMAATRAGEIGLTTEYRFRIPLDSASTATNQTVMRREVWDAGWTGERVSFME